MHAGSFLSVCEQINLMSEEISLTFSLKRLDLMVLKSEMV